MTPKVRLRWLLGALIGVVAAVCLGFLAIPQLGPAPAELPVVVMDDYSAEDVRRFRRARPPAPEPQPVPTPQELPVEHGEHWERAHDRADWIGGATVTCDIGHLVQDARTAFLDMDQGVHLEGQVDVTSRFYSPIEGGRITFTARAMAGTTRLLIPETDERPALQPGETMNTKAVRIRWSGATPGTTVGCDGAWEDATGLLQVQLEDDSGALLDEEGRWNAGMPALLRGCGLMFPMLSDPTTVEVATGRCVLQIERRHPRFPFIANRGERVAVDILPGQTTRISLRLPDEPPLYQPPDLNELETAADVAASFGSDAAADALEELIDKISSGQWNGETLAELLQLAGDDAGQDVEPGAVELSDEEVEAIVDRELSENPELMDEAMVQDPELIQAFADDVAAGGGLDQFPPQTRAAIEAELARREGR